MNKLIKVFSHNGIQLQSEKEQTIHKCNFMDEFQNNYAKWMKPYEKST